MKLREWIVVGILSCSTLASASELTVEECPLLVSPEKVEIGMFYSGVTVRAEGTAGADSQVVLVVRGPDHEETFNRKVRAGPIWISSGHVKISGVPSLFLSFSSGPVRSLLSDEVISRHSLDLQAIRNHMVLEASDADADEAAMRDSYLDLKTQRGTYQVHDNAALLEDPAGAEIPFSVELSWPRIAPPATYAVTAYECRDGAVVRIHRAQLEVVKVGLPDEIYAFAMHEAPKYGAISVLIAVLAGFGIDFLAARIFGSSPKGAH